MIELKRVTAFTVQEVAEALRLTPATIRRYIKSGTIKAQKVGSKWYITDEILEDVITGKETASSVVSSKETGDEISFEEFVKRVKKGIEDGKIKLSVELDERDYAIQYAIGRAFQDEQKRQFTYEEIAELVVKYCGMDVFNRVFSQR